MQINLTKLQRTIEISINVAGTLRQEIKTLEKIDQQIDFNHDDYYPHEEVVEIDNKEKENLQKYKTQLSQMLTTQIDLTKNLLNLYGSADEQ